MDTAKPQVLENPYTIYGARAGAVTPRFVEHLLAAHRRLVPIDHSHSCSPHHSASRDVAGFSRFVRGVKWRHQTLGGSVRGSEALMDTENMAYACTHQKYR